MTIAPGKRVCERHPGLVVPKNISLSHRMGEGRGEGFSTDFPLFSAAILHPRPPQANQCAGGTNIKPGLVGMFFIR